MSAEPFRSSEAIGLDEPDPRLKWDAFRGGLYCRRWNGYPLTNVPRSVTHKDRSSFEWWGSPVQRAEFLLNLAAAVYPVGCDDLHPVPGAIRGQCSRLSVAVALRLRPRLDLLLRPSGIELDGISLRVMCFTAACEAAAERHRIEWARASNCAVYARERLPKWEIHRCRFCNESWQIGNDFSHENLYATHLDMASHTVQHLPWEDEEVIAVT